MTRRIEFEPMSITAIGGPWSSRPFGMIAGERLRAFDEAAELLNVPRERRHTAWLLFQWVYCELAGMRSRVVASPEAIKAAGYPVTAEDVSTACELLLASESL